MTSPPPAPVAELVRRLSYVADGGGNVTPLSVRTLCREAADLIARLPLTADGVVVVPRVDSVLFPERHGILRSAAWDIDINTPGEVWKNPNGRPVSEGYSTVAAAQAARGEK